MDEYVKVLNRMPNSDILNEAGNISSALAIKQQNKVIQSGKSAKNIRVKDKKLNDKLDAIAEQNAALAGMVLMGIAVSGDGSFTSTIAKGLSLRGI